MEKLKQIYEGKAKILYDTDQPDYVIQYFKDDATAFNAQKRGTIQGKGVMNNQISTIIFEYLQKNGIPTHFEKKLNDREMLVKKVTIVPIEVIIRNRAAGSLCKMLALPEGKILACSVLEYCFKQDSLNDPMINEYHIKALEIASESDLETIKSFAFKVNELMKKFFDAIGIELIDFKLEFGRFKGKIILADEISPDTCRLWEKGTGKKLDKDRFRRDLGQIEEAYQEVLKRVSQK